MTTDPTARNATGVMLTQAQLDESARQDYWQLSIRAALDYYISGRFSAAHAHIPVCANILHHAVEMMLKGCLAHDDPLDTIRQYHKKSVYGHDLDKLWEEFKSRQTEPVPAEFDTVIKQLNDFEDIRYPDNLIRLGARILIDRYDVPEMPHSPEPEPLYRLKLPQIDRLMGLLFEASHANPGVFLPPITDDEHALRHYDNFRKTLFGVGAPRGS